jgi:hypothetical protein
VGIAKKTAVFDSCYNYCHYHFLSDANLLPSYLP